MGKQIGKSVKRVEDPRFIQGQGKYVANINLPNMAHVAVLRSLMPMRISTVSTRMLPRPWTV